MKIHFEWQRRCHCPLWDAQTAQEIHRFVGLGGDVLSARFSPDGKYLLTGARTLKLWDTTTYIELRHYPVQLPIKLGALYFRPDGKNILIANSDGIAEKWFGSTGTNCPSLAVTWDVSSATFSPDGKYVFTGSLDGTARLWDAKTGVELKRFVSASTHSTGNFARCRYLLTAMMTTPHDFMTPNLIRFYPLPDITMGCIVSLFHRMETIF